MAASLDGKVELIQVPDGASIGERLGLGSDDDQTLSYAPFAPDKVKKKKAWEAVVPHLKTSSEKGLVMYKDLPVVTKAGPCFAPSVCGGEVR